MSKYRLKRYSGSVGFCGGSNNVIPYWRGEMRVDPSEIIFSLRLKEGCIVGDLMVLANEKYNLTVITHSSNVEEVNLHTINIDGKEIEISEESYKELKKSLLGEEQE